MASSSSPALACRSHEDESNDDTTAWERFKAQWLTCGLECGVTWFFAVLGLFYFYVANHCMPLILRLFLHLVLFIGGYLMVLKLWALLAVYRRAYGHHPHEHAARVTRLQNFPEQPHPMIPTKTLAWLEYVDPNGNIIHNGDCENNETRMEHAISETRSTPTGPPEDTSAASSVSPDTSPDRTLAVDSDSLCVQVDPTANVQVGDSLQVTWLEGDAARPVYRPFLQLQFQQNLWTGVQIGLFVVAVTLALQYTMPGIPIVFASATQLETFYQSNWFCTLGTGEDTEDELAEDLADCCSITTTHVMASYRLFLGAMLGGLALLTLRMVWRVRRIVNGANGGSYQMLSVASGGAEDETHGNE